MATGWFKGSAFLTSSSGNTTSVAQVWSVVRTKLTVASDPGVPFGMASESGEKPCSLAVTRSSPGAAGASEGVTVLASDFLSHPLSEATKTMAAARVVKEFIRILVTLEVGRPQIRRGVRRKVATLQD